MAIAHGNFTTYDSPYLSEDIRGLAVKIDPRLTVSWDLIPEKEPGTSTSLKWYDAVRNTLDGAVRGSSWDATATTGLGINDNLAVIVQIGDILRIESEYVIVSAVSSRATGAGAISVYARGHGSSSGAIHADTTAITIVGNAQLEGNVDIDGLSEDTIERTNFYQLVEEMVKVTKTSANTQFKDIEDKVDWERQGALRRALKKMNKTVFYGIKYVGTKTVPRTAGGFEEYINSATYGAVRINQGGAFTEAGLKNLLREIALRGGMPKVVLMSPKNKAVANGFNASIVRTDRSDTQAGVIVNEYLDENGTVSFVSDPSMRDDVIFAINPDKLGKQWYANDTLRFVEETNVNSRTYAETLQGQFSLEVKDVAFEHGCLYGVTV